MGMNESGMEFVLAGGSIADQGHSVAIDQARQVLQALFGPEVGEAIRRNTLLRPLITPVVSSRGADKNAVRLLSEAAGVALVVRL